MSTLFILCIHLKENMKLLQAWYIAIGSSLRLKHLTESHRFSMKHQMN